MDLYTELELISKINVETKIKDDEDVCKTLLFTIYFALEEYPQIFGKSFSNLKDIENVVTNNLLSINNGADPMSIFYFLNNATLKNTNFGQYYQVFLNFVEEVKNDLGEYTLVNIYDTLARKFDIYNGK